VTVLSFAMSGLDGRSRLFRRGAGVLSTLYDQDVYGSKFEPGEEVETLSLDGLFSRFGIDTCTLLKLDCEGAEYDVLLKASAASLAAVRTIAGEYHVGLNSHTPEELAEHLRAHGFLARILPLADLESGLFYAWRLK
jgi:hypothetical protein